MDQQEYPFSLKSKGKNILPPLVQQMDNTGPNISARITSKKSTSYHDAAV